jgi:hypothetical protein
MAYGIAVSTPNVNIDNVIIDIQIPNMTGNSPIAQGINIASNQVTINNANITSERNIVINRTDDIVQDLKISNSVLNVPSWGSLNISVYGGSYGFKNLKIANVTATNNSTGAGSNALIDTTTLSGSSNSYKGKGLNIVNTSFTYLGNVINKYGMNLKYIDDLSIVNFDYSNDGATKAYRGIVADTCTNVRISNFACNALLQVAVQLSNVTGARVLGLTSSSADYSVSVSNSTGAKLKDVDNTKVLLNDSLSLQNSALETNNSSGTTANRPININIGHTHFDTTLNKPIWCKQVTPSIIWVDSTGATV